MIKLNDLFCFLIILIVVSVPKCFSTVDDLRTWHLFNNSESDRNQIVSDWSRLKINIPRLLLDTLQPSFVLKQAQHAAQTLSNVSKECRDSISNLENQAATGESNALLMLDAWGKFPPSGFLHGSWSSLGSFHQCLALSDAQYCTIRSKPSLSTRPRFHNLVQKLPFLESHFQNESQAFKLLLDNAQAFYYTSFRLGICLPPQCSENELNEIVSFVSNKTYIQSRLHRCETRTSSYNLDLYQAVAIVFIAVIVALCLAGTLSSLIGKTDRASINKSKNTVKFNDYLCAFSVTKNAKAVFNCRTQCDELLCLNGIRVLTNIWIMFGHTVIWSHREGFSHNLNILNLLLNPVFQSFLNAMISVDTFFFISGLLTSYVTWKSTNGSYKQLNVRVFVFARYLRLTPGLIFSVCGVLLLPLTGSGPLFKDVITPVTEGCRRNWWVNLLYLQNLINPEHICNLPSWWLSNDFQMHLMSIPVIFWLLKKSSIGLALNMLMILLSFCLASIAHFERDFPPYVVPTQPQIEEYWNEYILHFIYRPYLHMGPFFIGLHLGYILSQKQLRTFSQLDRVCGWTLALLTMFVILNVPYVWTIGQPYSRAVAVLFDCTCRLFWSAALFWIVYACASGNGGLFNRFLSWKGFIPFARMTYMTFLTHMYFIWWYFSTRQHVIYSSVDTLTFYFIPLVLFAYTFGLLATLLFESPFLVLLKLVFASKSLPLPKEEEEIVLQESPEKHV